MLKTLVTVPSITVESYVRVLYGSLEGSFSKMMKENDCLTKRAKKHHIGVVTTSPLQRRRSMAAAANQQAGQQKHSLAVKDDILVLPKPTISKATVSSSHETAQPSITRSSKSSVAPASHRSSMDTEITEFGIKSGSEQTLREAENQRKKRISRRSTIFSSKSFFDLAWEDVVPNVQEEPISFDNMEPETDPNPVKKSKVRRDSTGMSSVARCKTMSTLKNKFEAISDRSKLESDVQQARMVQARMLASNARRAKADQEHLIMVSGAGRRPRLPHEMER